MLDEIKRMQADMRNQVARKKNKEVELRKVELKSRTSGPLRTVSNPSDTLQELGAAGEKRAFFG